MSAEFQTKTAPLESAGGVVAANADYAVCDSTLPDTEANGAKQPEFVLDAGKPQSIHEGSWVNSALWDPKAVHEADPFSNEALHPQSSPSIEPSCQSKSTAEAPLAEFTYFDAKTGKASVVADAAIYDLATELGIDHKKVPELVMAAMQTKTQEKNARMIEEGLTPKGVERWLVSESGRRWFAANEARLPGNLRERIKAGAPGIGVGVLGYLGAVQLAEVIGISPIHQPEEHFAFIIGCMHTMGTAAAYGLPAAQMGWRRLANWRSSWVITSGGQPLKVTLRTDTKIGSSLYRSIARNFAGMSAAQIAARGAIGIITFPAKLSLGMAPGLASVKVADMVLPQSMNPEFREALTFGAFFAPDVASIILGKRCQALARFPGAAIFLQLVAAGFTLDMAVMGIQRLMWGDETAYRRSIEARMSERIVEEKGYEAAKKLDGMHWSYRWAAEALYFVDFFGMKSADFLAPIAIEHKRYRIAMDEGHGDWYSEIVYEDIKRSELLQDSLPDYAGSVLADGVDGMEDDPDFYRVVSLDFLREKVKLKGSAKKLSEETEKLQRSPEFSKMNPDEREAAFMEILDEIPEDELQNAVSLSAAYDLQSMLAILDFYRLDINSTYEEVVDEHGVIEEGKEDEFLALVFPDMTAEEAKETILSERKQRLIMRALLTEDKAEYVRLFALCKEVGIVDEAGEWEMTDELIGVLTRLGVIDTEPAQEEPLPQQG